MKNKYQKPVIRMVKPQFQHQLLTVGSVRSESGMSYGGGSDGEAHSREGGWDDEE